jgi:hypothetical protein
MIEWLVLEWSSRSFTWIEHRDKPRCEGNVLLLDLIRLMGAPSVPELYEHKVNSALLYISSMFLAKIAKITA